MVFFLEIGITKVACQDFLHHAIFQKFSPTLRDENFHLGLHMYLISQIFGLLQHSRMKHEEQEQKKNGNEEYIG